MSAALKGIQHSSRNSNKLRLLYQRILQLSEKIPKEAVYRANVEAIACHRLSILKEACGNEEEIENNICSGNITSLILQAENEYELMQKFIFCKPWEPLTQKSPPGQWLWPPGA